MKQFWNHIGFMSSAYKVISYWDTLYRFSSYFSIYTIKLYVSVNVTSLT